MVEALVKDCEQHLVALEERRTTLESDIASNKDEESLRVSNQSLAKSIIDYKNAAKHCKKHSTAPAQPKGKAAAKAKPAAAP